MDSGPRGDLIRATRRRAFLVGAVSVALIGVRPGRAGAARPTVVVHRDPT